MKYEIVRTETADACMRKIILYVAQNFGNRVALEKLDHIEKRILELVDKPYIGTDLNYLVLKRQGYKVLVLEKDLVFYKIDEENKKETKNKRIFIGSPRMMETEQFSELIAELDHAAFSEDPNIREVVKKLVPEYTYKQTNQQTK